ncbi:SCO1860 family LAETG-anchored protein [Kitasatospora mediocidica]|uniref:SCO1860 family LAETG-anchored protein n=1 Tax=Kitasatospora mediocidica TaxID=58352 RepID=UPI000B23C2B2|nr:SCO1860 family LAETG-anchored protein [Kitasatospora mediocidica]
MPSAVRSARTTRSTRATRTTRSTRATRLVRSTSALLAGTALLALPTAASAAPGQEGGQANAVTAELALNVSLLNSAVQVPVDIALNKVQSPAQHSGSMLTATVGGVDQQGPITLVKADIGKSVTHIDAQGAEASVQLVNADVHAPGLPLSTLLGLQALSSEVSCPVDGPPTAKVTAPAKLTVLGKSVTLSLYGSTHVAVPGIGSVDISYSPHTTTSTTAAAAALVVNVALNPLQLNVAKVDGTVTIASVSCVKPGGSGSGGGSGTSTGAASAPASAPSAAASGPAGAPVVAAVADTSVPLAGDSPSAVSPSSSAKPTTGQSLAFTGSSGTGTIAGGAAALLAAGGGALWLTRRRRSAAHKG